jgi:hypothetical protein
MGSSLYLGTMCIMLEDLGFKLVPEPPSKSHIIEMTYHVYSTSVQRIYADISKRLTVELFLQKDELLIDKWEWDDDIHLFIVTDDLNLSLCDPKSVSKASSFISQLV